MIRWIVMQSYLYDGMWPPESLGDEHKPLPSFETHQEATEWAKKHDLISPGGTELLAIEVDS